MASLDEEFPVDIAAKIEQDVQDLLNKKPELSTEQALDIVNRFRDPRKPWTSEYLINHLRDSIKQEYERSLAFSRYRASLNDPNESEDEKRLKLEASNAASAEADMIDREFGPAKVPEDIALLYHARLVIMRV